MGVFVGLIIAVAAMLGGYVAMGGKLAVLWQPFEYLMVCGIAAGVFVMANPLPVIRDTPSAIRDAVANREPRRAEYLALLGCLFALMRDLRSRPRNEVEAHVDDPDGSELFKQYPSIQQNRLLLNFVCDYVRLILIGNARSYEIEALMDEEIGTIRKTKLRPYLALSSIADGLPAIGIVAAVLGIVKAMGAIDQAPTILGGYIAAALVGTFTGIFLSYGVVGPLAQKIKSVREKQMQPFVIAKQSLIAFMNGAMPQIALEHGRKTISAANRPSIDEVENEAVAKTPGPGVQAAA